MTEPHRRRRDEVARHPLQTGPADPPPPAREQLPLPRRRRQAHLEPRLREAGDAGSGTPFEAFSAAEPGQTPTTGQDIPAAYRAGARLARRASHRDRGAE